jgi:hypothetical protein
MTRKSPQHSENDIAHALTVLDRAIYLFKKLKKPNRDDAKKVYNNRSYVRDATTTSPQRSRQSLSLSTSEPESPVQAVPAIGESAPAGSTEHAPRVSEEDESVVQRRASHSNSSNKDALPPPPSSVNDVEANVSYGLELL